MNASYVDMRFVKPLDTTIISEMAENHDYIVTVEDNVIAGGAGSAVGEYLATQQTAVKLMHIGLPDEFIMQGTQEEMYAVHGLDEAGIATKIQHFIQQ